MKKQRKLQKIPGNGKQLAPSMEIKITVVAGRVQVHNFPANLDMTLDILHQAIKEVVNFFLNEFLKQKKEAETTIPRKREFLGVRPS